MGIEMERILLGHGSGGRLMHELIKNLFQPEFGLIQLNDSAIIGGSYFYSGCGSFRQAFTTDSYVVSPIFSPAAT